jgi:hypothetical protein
VTLAGARGELSLFALLTGLAFTHLPGFDPGVKPLRHEVTIPI